MNDSDWLKEFVEQKSEATFARLVERHIDLVYSAALRQVKDRHLAEDITQAVFIALINKAGTLRREVSVASWLLVTTRYIALDSIKAQLRRRRHERKAADMAQPISRTPEDRIWTELSPHLDAALAALNDQDRRAITLRYFEQMSLKQVATATGVSLEAARQRVHRATVRMRAFFSRRGVVVPTTVLGVIILGHAVRAAPVELAANVTRAALAAKATSAAALGTSNSFFSASKGKVLLMAISKTKLAVGVVGVLLLCSGGVVGYRALRPSESQTLIVSSQPQITNLAEAEWKKRLYKTYSLAEGQIVKQVAPPMIPERQQYWDSQSGAGRSWPLNHDESFVFSWDGSDARWISLTSGAGGFEFVLQAATKLKHWQLDSSVPLGLRFAGDWVIRKDASIEQVMNALAAIVSQRLGHPVHFEKRTVMAEALVARGSYHFVPLPGNSDNGLVDLVGGKAKAENPPPSNTRSTTLAELLALVSNYTGQQVIDETGSSKAVIKVRDHQIPQEIASLLANISAQTSIRLEPEPRQIEKWFMVDASDSATKPSSRARSLGKADEAGHSNARAHSNAVESRSSL